MGKFQSKIVSKRRQSPEGKTTHGGTLACNAQTCRKELKLIHDHKCKLTENLCVELRENRLNQTCSCNVLPLRKTDKSIYIQINKRIKKKKGGADVRDTESVVVPDENSRQQWVFTLCNDSRGKVTKEDMFRLIQSVHEVIEASVTQHGRTPLRIKLAVTPTALPDKVSQTAEKEQSTLQRAGDPDRKLYCVDENIERRNHYLDLAGIENYASRFDSTESVSQEPTQNAHPAARHHTVAERGNCLSSESPRGVSVPHSLKTKSPPVRNDRNRGEGKNYKHPASWCHLSPSHPPTHSVLHRSHSKRLHCRVQDAGSHLRGDRELWPFQPCCGVSMVQKHEHHHHHDHHHHHHHHYPTS